MAQAISNSVQSPNKLTGLLGLTPKASPLGTQTSTPALMKAPAPFNFANTPGATNTFDVATKQMQQPNVAPAPLPQAQPQNQAIQSAPVQMNPPAQMSAPTNPAIAANGPASLGAAAQPVRGLFPSVVSSLAQKGNEVNPITTDAYTQAQKLQQQIKDTKDAEATSIAHQAGPIPQGDITGRQAVARQLYETRLANLGSQFQGQTNLATLGNTVQNTQQSALSTAGNLSAPQVTPYGQTSFDPSSNTFNGGGGSLPPEVMQQYAQMAATGQYSAIPSFITSNPVLNAQLNVAAKAFNPNYTPVGAQGASGVLQGIPAMQSANTAADGIKNQIQAYIQANPQLNPSDLAAGNQLQQWIQGKQLTDPKYQTLFNYLDEYTNTLAPILGVGGNPTNFKTQIAQGFINAAASGQSISQVLDSMSILATNKIADLQRGAIGQGTAIPSANSGAGGFAETW